MHQGDVQSQVRTAVSVPRQHVVVAKGLITSKIGNKTMAASALVDIVLRDIGITLPEKVVIHSSVDVAAQVKAVANAISWKLAVIEAICSLVGSGLLIAGGNSWNFNPSIGYTTIPPGGGSGESGGLNWAEFAYSCPSDIKLAPSATGEMNQFLWEPDLYLNTLSIPNMHVDIQSALREAVLCFRAELYLATVAMLGKASEGSWIEVGGALLNAASKHSSTFAKQRTVLDDPMTGPARKVEAVSKMYERQDIFSPIAESSGVRPRDLPSIALWSETVRDSRNTLHFLAQPVTPNTYEKVSLLLLSTINSLRPLYQIKYAAEKTSLV
jgi:hypothetical protein